MKGSIERIGALLDAKRDLLIHIKEANPLFYDQFVHKFFKSRLTFEGFEQDLVRALSAVLRITIFIRESDLTVGVTHETSGGTEIKEFFDCYEDALRFAIGLLHIKSV